VVAAGVWQVARVAAFLRPLAWFAAFLGALAVLAAWLVPPRLDWSVYREELQRIASAELGREFRINGPFALTLLPAPRLVARGVAIGEPGDSVTGTAEELRLTLALGRFLIGEVAVTELTLVAPRIAIRDVPIPLWAAAVRPAPFLAGTRVSLERGEITVGAVKVVDMSGRLSAQGPLGPYTLNGRFALGGLPVEAQLTLGRAGLDGAATLEAAFTGRGARVALAGVVLHGGFVFSGGVEAEGPDLSALLPAPALPFRAEARLALEGGAGSADQLSLQIGPSRLSGAVSFATQPEPRMDIALAGVRFALDPWVAPARGSLSPPPFPIGLDLSLEAAEIGGGTLRSLRSSLLIADGQVAVNEASAVLPGGAALALAGAVAVAERGPRFEGLVELDAPDLRLLLAWLALEPSWAGPDALRTLTLSGRVLVEQGAIQFEQASARLDGVAVEGGVVVRPGAEGGAVPEFGAGLRFARLDLDTLLAGQDRWAALGALPPVEANLRLEADELVTRGIVAREVTLDASFSRGRLMVRRLASGSLAGGALSLSGAGETGARGRISSFDLDFSGADASRLAALVPGSELLAAAAPLWQGGFTVRASGRAAGERMQITGLAEMLDARLEVAGSADASFAGGSGRVALRHPGAPRLLAALGIPGTNAWLGEGSLSVVAEGALAGRTLTLASAEIVAGVLRTRLAGEVALEGRGGRFRLSAEAENLPLPAPAWTSTDPLDLVPLAAWSGTLAVRAAEMPVGPSPGLSAVEARADLADGTLRIASISGRLRGGTITASASLSSAGALAVDFALADAVIDRPQFELPFDLAGGSFGVTASVTARGLSPSAWLSSLGGEARILAANGVLVGFDLAAATEALTAPLPEAEALARVRRSLSGGATAFEQLALALTAERGVVSITDFSFRSQSGHGLGTGEIDLRAEAIGLALAITPVGGAEALPEIGLRASGPLADPRRVVETAAVARHLGERARVRRQ
jgi:hypothetical protein